LIRERDDVSSRLAVEPNDCAGPAVPDVTMFGSLSRPGEPRPPNHQFNFSNSHFTVVPVNSGDLYAAAHLWRTMADAFRKTTMAFVRPCVRRDDRVWVNARPRIPRRVAPELSMFLPPKEGVGNAGWQAHPQPRVAKMKTTRVSHRRYTPVSPGIPAREWF
jgi:hypothetical protein